MRNHYQHPVRMIVILSILVLMVAFLPYVNAEWGRAEAGSKYKVTGDQAKDILGIAYSCKGKKLDATKKKIEIIREEYVLDWLWI